MKKNLFVSLMDQFNDPASNMADYIALTKKVIKSISKSANTHGASDTCMDIIINGYSDVIMDDLVQEIATAILVYGNENNIRVASSVFNKRLVPVFDTWDVDGKDINGYVYLCKVVRMYLEKNKNQKIDLCGDCISDGADDEDVASPNRLSEYIRIASINADVMNTYEDNNIRLFFDYVKKDQPKVYNELRMFSFYLMNGIKINSIANRMDITESRAYWLRKKLSKVYSEYNHIDRKIISFAKIDCTVKRWVTIPHYVTEDGTGYQTIAYFEDVLQDVPCTTYKRVFEKDAKITIAGKTHKTTVCLDYNGDVVIPKEGTRIKRYVVNMSKDAIHGMSYGCATDNKAVGNNHGFSYTTGGYNHSYISESMHNNVLIVYHLTKDAVIPQRINVTIRTTNEDADEKRRIEYNRLKKEWYNKLYDSTLAGRMDRFEKAEYRAQILKKADDVAKRHAYA